jgi:hypothetical protein
VFNDTELNSAEMLDSSLVLVGNAQSNSVWRELIAGVNLSISDDRITLGNRTWHGDCIAIQAVMNHPKSRSHRIIVIGGNIFSPDSFATLNLSRDGWFRYAIWELTDEGSVLRSAGL